MLSVVGNTLYFQHRSYRCAIGKGGFSDNKKEGDGCTPLGSFALRECWYRADKLGKPSTLLPVRIISKDDGWSDDPKAADYNRHVTLPYGFSHERLWREDDMYDLIVPLGYNDQPIVAGKGSAIFLHVARPGYEPTEGCVALAKADLLAILPYFSTGGLIEITEK